MPTPTYFPLATTTLASASASVTFSGIPTDGTYRDLVVVVSGLNDSGANITAILNNDTSSNYSFVYMLGNGSTTGSGAGSNTAMQGSGGYTMSVFQLFDYSATDKHKTGLFRDGSASVYVAAWANRWANTAAVTSVKMSNTAGNFVSGTTLSVYGIAS